MCPTYLCKCEADPQEPCGICSDLKLLGSNYVVPTQTPEEEDNVGEVQIGMTHITEFQRGHHAHHQSLAAPKQILELAEDHQAMSPPEVGQLMMPIGPPSGHRPQVMHVSGAVWVPEVREALVSEVPVTWEPEV